MREYTNTVYAGFFLRFWAYLIDLAITSAATAAVVTPIFLLLSLPIGTEALSIYGITKLVLFLLYFVLMTKFTNGQTLGKMILGLRVISATEETLTWGTVLFREGVGRYILKTIPGGLLYLVTAFTPKKQGIADLFSDTFVVKEDAIQLIKELTEVAQQSPLMETD